MKLMIAILALMSLPTPVRAEDVKERRDVKDAALRIIRAVEDHDTKAARALAVPTRDAVWADIQLCMDEEYQQWRLGREVFKRFPTAKQEWPENPDELIEELKSLLKDAPVAINGNNAIIEIGRLRLKLQRIDAVWRFDLESFLLDERRRAGGDWAKSAREKAAGYTKMVERVAAGEFKSVHEVMDAMAAAGLIAVSSTQPVSGRAK